MVVERLFASSIAILLATASFAAAPAVKNAVRFEQNLGARIPEADVVDEYGKLVKLSGLLASGPTILVFAYYKCPNLCSLVLDGLAEALRKMPSVLGKDYQVVTISIDPRETRKTSLAKTRSTLARLGVTLEAYPQGSPWRFLTASAADILKLTKAAGFYFRYDPVSGEYSHPSGILVLTPTGKISQYFFGIRFSPPKLEAALALAAAEKRGTLVERIFLYCLHYQANQGKHGALILVLIRASAGLTVFALLIGLARLFGSDAGRA